MAADYWDKIKRRLRPFWLPGDDLRCVGHYERQFSHCELCGKDPITQNYVLENNRTKQRLNVGSECIRNFKIAVAELSEEARVHFPPTVRIAFPRTYEKLAAKFNAVVPNLVEVDDFEIDEIGIVISERLSDAEDWARSNEEGWYYIDHDENRQDGITVEESKDIVG